MLFAGGLIPHQFHSSTKLSIRNVCCCTPKISQLILNSFKRNSIIYFNLFICRQSKHEIHGKRFFSSLSSWSRLHFKIKYLCSSLESLGDLDTISALEPVAHFNWAKMMQSKEFSLSVSVCFINKFILIRHDLRVRSRQMYLFLVPVVIHELFSRHTYLIFVGTAWLVFQFENKKNRKNWI